MMATLMAALTVGGHRHPAPRGSWPGGEGEGLKEDEIKCVCGGTSRLWSLLRGDGRVEPLRRGQGPQTQALGELGACHSLPP